LPRFWNIRVTYDPSGTYLVVENALAQYAKTSNQLEAASGVANAGLTLDDSLNQVYDMLERADAEGKRNALEQLGGEVFSSAASVGFQNTSNWLGSLGNHLRPSGRGYAAAQLAGTANGGRNSAGAGSLDGDSVRLVSYNPAFGFSSPTPDFDAQLTEHQERLKYTARYDGWTGGYGARGVAPSDGNAHGLDYRFAGSSFGVDRYLGDGTTVGFAGGFSGTNIGTKGLAQEADIYSYQAALYGGRTGERFYAFNVLSYGFNDYSTVRKLPGGLTARGEYDGNEVSDYLEAGMSWPDQERCWQPSVSVQYIGLQRNAFTESGAGGAGLAVDSQMDHSLRPGAGIRLVSPTMWKWVTLVPEFNARYAYELIDAERTATAHFSGVGGGSFRTAGNQLGRHFGRLGFGVNTMLTRRLTLYGGFDLLTADTALAQAGSGSLQYLW
jgi:uncharacterized protein with beta-barrel porin domain